MDVLIEVLPLPAFPNSAGACIKLAAKFKISRTLHSPLDGCIGVLEDIAILIIQDIGDSDYRSSFFSAKSAGSTHDSVAFKDLHSEGSYETGSFPPATGW
eukprot:IDg18257t1